MGTPLNVEGFRHKLANMNSTQDSVQTMALWVVHHRSHFKQIVEVWIQSLRDATKESHRLTLMYLANDVIQNSRRKGVSVFKDGFAGVLEEAASLCRDESIRKSVLRIITIWEERNIFDSEFCEKLLAASVSSQSIKPKVDAKFLATFNPADVPSAIENLTQFEGEVELRRNQLNNMNVDVASIESIAKLKDRAGGKRFSEQFEDGACKLEEYVKSLRKEVEMRKELLELLKKSEIFYDAQFSEAKIVTNAYKNFSTRVSILKKRLEEYKKHLPTKGSSPIPSPSVDAPSPGATPPEDPEADKVDVEDMEVSDEEDGVQRGSIMAVSTASTKRAVPKTTRKLPPPPGNLDSLAKLTGASFLTGGLSFNKPGSATDTPSPTGSNNSAPSPENSPSESSLTAEEPPVKTESPPQTIPIVPVVGQQEDDDSDTDTALYGPDAMPTPLVPYTDQADDPVKEENPPEESRDGSTPLRDEVQTSSNLQKVVNEATANPIAFLSKIIHSTKTSTTSGSGPSHSFISSLSMLTKSVQSAVAKENISPSKEQEEKPEDTSRKKDPLKESKRQVSEEKTVPSSKSLTHPFGLGQFLANLSGGNNTNNEENESDDNEVDLKGKENNNKTIPSYSHTSERSAFGNVSEAASPELNTGIGVSTSQQFVNTTTTTSTTLTSASSNPTPVPLPVPPPVPPPNERSHTLPELPPGPPPGPPPPNARRGPLRSFDKSEEDQSYEAPPDTPTSEPSVIMYEMEPDDVETEQTSYEDQYNSAYELQGPPFSNFQVRSFNKSASEQQQIPTFSNFQEGKFSNPGVEHQVPPFSSVGTFNRLTENEPVTSFSSIQGEIYNKAGTEEQANFYPNIQGDNFTKQETEQQVTPFSNVQGGNFVETQSEPQVTPFHNVQVGNFIKQDTQPQSNLFPTVQGDNYMERGTEQQVTPFPNVQGGSFPKQDIEPQVTPFSNLHGGNFPKQDIEPQVTPFSSVQGVNFTKPDMEQQSRPFANVQGDNFLKPNAEQPINSFTSTQGGNYTNVSAEQPITSYSNAQGGNFLKPEVEQQTAPYTSISAGNFPKSNVYSHSQSYSNVPIESRYSTSPISDFFATPPVSIPETSYNVPPPIHQDPSMQPERVPTSPNDIGFGTQMQPERVPMQPEQVPTSPNDIGFGTQMHSEGDISHVGNEQHSYSQDLQSPPADVTSPISVIGGGTQYPYPPSSEPTSPTSSPPVVESRGYSPTVTIPVLGQTSSPWSPPIRGTIRNDQDLYRNSQPSAYPYNNYNRQPYTGSSFRRGSFPSERSPYVRPYRPRGRGNWYGDMPRRHYPRSRPFNYR
ncbi:Regulation of nuclear pre-mRNA domain-containing protein 2 [Holothuria leucospilota]|uniref:Regulation of nuclear pre-mRNA domain-containing protein 2 n=1 Tax=Holothuria leucospilota TaxID=206669 RepID=A0A9Q1BND5_HOLLE|nr:Regulation of nuclear pre-mRNA domain-containing protein 2 [Holothuria leucospilota]